MRVLTHGVLVYFIVQGLQYAVAPHAPGITTILRTINYAGYAPFSLSVSIGLHNARMLCIALVAAIILLGYPFTIPELAHMLQPVGAGILLGQLVKQGLTKEAEHA